MSSLRLQTIEISAATAVTVASLAAALTGALFGFAGARRSIPRQTKRLRPTGRDESGLPQWHQLTDVEPDAGPTNDEIETVRRDYELDIGLLKQEIQRLEELLSLSTNPPRVVSVESGSQERRRDADSPGRIHFSTLDELSTEAARSRVNR